METCPNKLNKICQSTVGLI